MLELLAGVLIAAGAVYYVLRPILRPPPGGWAESPAASEGDDPEDDLSAQAVALRALKEIEFDRATGKLSDADYDMLRAKYQAEALAALRGGPAPAAQRAPAAQGPPRSAAAVCPVDGPRPEADAAFCSACGRRLSTAPGYCARCGSALEADARYCNHCGTRVAA